jgi:hypothetical protein
MGIDPLGSVIGLVGSVTTVPGEGVAGSGVGFTTTVSGEGVIDTFGWTG